MKDRRKSGLPGGGRRSSPGPRGVRRVRMCITVPEQLRREMERHPEVNWSAAAARAFRAACRSSGVQDVSDASPFSEFMANSPRLIDAPSGATVREVAEHVTVLRRTGESRVWGFVFNDLIVRDATGVMDTADKLVAEYYRLEAHRAGGPYR